MLDHLITFELEPCLCPQEPDDFVGLDRTSPKQVLSAQFTTANWLEQAGLTAAHTDAEAAATTARQTFNTLTTVPDTPTKVQALLDLTLPQEVQHIVAMLTAYDWQFVEKAGEIRNYVVGRLMAETNDSKGAVRMKALELLGKITEVSLFTEKVEIKKTDMTDEEINERIKEKINSFLKITDATVIDVEDKDGQPDPA